MLLLGPLFIVPEVMSTYEEAMAQVPLVLSSLVFPWLVQGSGPSTFGQSVRRIIRAVGDNHAVAALGYDALISLGSAMVWSRGV